MSSQQISPRFSGYVRRLIDEGHLSAEQMQDAIEKSKKQKTKNKYH